MLEKNSIQRATVSDQGKKGEGLVWLADMPVYVPNVIPGDEIEFKGKLKWINDVRMVS